MTDTAFLHVGTHRRAHHADPADVAFGIYGFRMERGQTIVPIGMSESPKPGWIAVHPRLPFLYAVNEVRDFDGPDTGGVSAFAVDADTGALRFLGARPVAAMPCHCAVEASGRFLLVAAFGGGTVHMIALEPDGGLGAQVDVHHHRGASVHPKRQTAPHAHAVAIDPGNRFVLVPDLGTDRVEVYELDLAAGRLLPRPERAAALPPGSGPRHLAFSPDGRFAYLVNEMSATVTAFALDDGALQEIDTVDLLPPGFTGLRSGAAIVIHPDGRHLYATTRSHGSSGLPPAPGLDTVVWFAIDRDTGLLARRGQVPSGGAIPRACVLDPAGCRLLVAHQCSGTIVVFDLDPDDGTPVLTDRVIRTPVPVCLTFSRPSEGPCPIA